MSELNQLLTEKNEELLDKYMKSIETLVVSRYGEQSQVIFTSSIDTVPKKQFLLLMTLYQEETLRNHFLKDDAYQKKCTLFFENLRRATDRLLDFKMKKEEYVQQCIDAWVIS